MSVDLIKSDDSLHPANVICELCRIFYDWNWVTGTGGGMSICDGGKVYLTPSGVQKERIKPEDLFVMDLKTENYLLKPEKFKPSACTPLFLSCYNVRQAGACIHTHSHAAVLVSLLYKDEFRIKDMENIKAVPRVTSPGNLNNYETLVIPIIENKPHEDDLKNDIEEIMKRYPQTSAVIVRGHGIFIWASDVWKCKILNEALDYLMDLAVKMKKLGLETA